MQLSTISPKVNQAVFYQNTKSEIPPKIAKEAFVQSCTLADIRSVHANLRDADRLELILIHGNDDLWHLEYAYHMALASWAIYKKDKPIGVFGVSALSPLASCGIPWLMATEELASIARPFLRECKQYVQRMHNLFPHLENYVHAENSVACAWLRWLGFYFDEAKPYGKHKALFHRFYK